MEKFLLGFIFKGLNIEHGLKKEIKSSYLFKSIVFKASTGFKFKKVILK